MAARELNIVEQTLLADAPALRAVVEELWRVYKARIGDALDAADFAAAGTLCRELGQIVAPRGTDYTSF